MMHICVCVCVFVDVCVCVCVCVYLPENEDLVPHSFIQTVDAPPNVDVRGLGEIVQMVANSTCIHMRMC